MPPAIEKNSRLPRGPGPRSRMAPAVRLAVYKYERVGGWGADPKTRAAKLSKVAENFIIASLRLIFSSRTDP